MNKNWSIVMAAGRGTRMGQSTPKPYLKLGNKTILEHSLEPFLACEAIDEIVVVQSADDNHWQTIELATGKPIHLVTGGEERYNSVFNALAFVKERATDSDWVLIHDGVRPCITVSELESLIKVANDKQTSCILASPVSDTLKKSKSNMQIDCTVDRTQLWRAMTPQMFPFEKIYLAMQNILAKGISVTDEAEAMEQYGEAVHLVKGSAENIKITRPEDLIFAHATLTEQGRL